MTRRMLLIPCLILPLLTACMGGGGGGALQSGGAQRVDMGLFNETLASEYENVAAFEATFQNNPERAAYFHSKASAAQAGRTPAPEKPDDYASIPDFARDELDEARYNLVQAVELFNTPENAALLAMAQTRFDCWVMARAKIADRKATITCKDMYEDAMNVLDVPGLDTDKIYTIAFKSGLAELDDVSRKQIKEIARLFPQTGQFVVVMKTYSEGNKDSHKVLTMRRSIAVRNSLAQMGVSMDAIKLEAFGKSSTGRVDVQILTIAQAQERKASHIEEMFPNHF